MTPTRLTAWLALVFGLIELAFILRDGEDLLTPFKLGFALWLLSPYALLAVTARFGRFAIVVRGATVLAIIIGLLSSLMMAELTFHFTTWRLPGDAMPAIFLPALQHLFIIPSLALLFPLGAWLEHRKEKGADFPEGSREEEVRR